VRAGALWLAIVVIAGGACGGDDDGDDDGLLPDAGVEADAAVDGDAGVEGDAAAGGPFDERPYQLLVPDSYDPGTPTPLIVLLHGYTATGAIQLAYFGLADVAEEQGLLVAYPDGTVDGVNNQFWNATDACCNFSASDVDDVAYLTAVMDDVAARYNVDPARVYMVGHSNGGFMSHRMACDRADRVAAIVSLAGATWADPAQCQPSEPVAILQVHGSSDATIFYGGGVITGNAYPAAADTVASWAALNGCTGELETSETPLDLDGSIAGDETRVDRTAGCPSAGAEVELWTIEKGSHVPSLIQPIWPETIVEFLLAHPKP
jgi:polyhydroxybutyrate depolymerase